MSSLLTLRTHVSTRVRVLDEYNRTVVQHKYTAAVVYVVRQASYAKIVADVFRIVTVGIFPQGTTGSSDTQSIRHVLQTVTAGRRAE